MEARPSALCLTFVVTPKMATITPQTPLEEKEYESARIAAMHMASVLRCETGIDAFFIPRVVTAASPTTEPVFCGAVLVVPMNSACTSKLQQRSQMGWSITWVPSFYAWCVHIPDTYLQPLLKARKRQTRRRLFGEN